MNDMLRNTRNIGISAHIDSGKTTLTERILYYAGRIHRMGEVRGGGRGAKMDFMDLEREKGITITSAATTLTWDGHRINLIDTPGHVDFTIEVERSLRALDGAVMVLCGVGGVQSQTITVDRQMKRYDVPRLTFINKLDRQGADPDRVVEAIRDKLRLVPVLIQIPIGLEDRFEGVVDLINMVADYFEGEHGEQCVTRPIPAALEPRACQAREAMLDTLCMYSDDMMALMLDDEPVPADMIVETLRRATLERAITPVLLGSAYKNRGVQNLLDAVVRYLPSPLDRQAAGATDIETGLPVALTPDPEAPLVALAFKLTEEPFGQLTYLRVYSGSIRKGDIVQNSRTRRRLRVGRVVRMHADERSDVDVAHGGDIIAVIGLDCASGDTLCSPDIAVSLEGLHVPEPVMTLAISPRKQDDARRLSKALNRFMREDPTFRVSVDPETRQTLIAGMGELHLEIYTERMRREYHADVEIGRPRVAYREAITAVSGFDYRHRKQTGGAGQYAHVVGRLEPSESPFEFANEISGGTIPKEFIPACEKGFRDACIKGPLAGFPVTGVRVVLADGSAHDVDSSDLAFRTAARMAFQYAFARARPVILEPIMRVDVETPVPFMGTVQGDLASRRGILMNAESGSDSAVILAEVPLAEMFGYATDLRSRTQGRATFTMEFSRYKQVPAGLQEALMDKALREKGRKRAA